MKKKVDFQKFIQEARELKKGLIKKYGTITTKHIIK